MKFFINSLLYRASIPNAKRVKANLTNGIIEILEGHEPIAGPIENNLVQVEKEVDNKILRFIYIIKNGTLDSIKEEIDDKKIEINSEVIVTINADEVYVGTLSEESIIELNEKCERCLKFLNSVKIENKDELSSLSIATNNNLIFYKECIRIIKELLKST